MSKPLTAERHSEDDPLLAAGQNARELRTKLAASFLACEAIAQQMQSIRAGLVLPARSVLFLEAPLSNAPRKEEPSKAVPPAPSATKTMP